VAQRRSRAIVQHVRSTATARHRLTTDQIMALTRGERWPTCSSTATSLSLRENPIETSAFAPEILTTGR